MDSGKPGFSPLRWCCSSRSPQAANFLKADFIRLKQLTFSYNFRKDLISKLHLTQARVYAQGVNLWTYSDYLGYDPEFVDAANSGSGIIPQSKGYTFGVQLGF